MKKSFLLLKVFLFTSVFTSLYGQQKFANLAHVTATQHPYYFIENDPANARFYTLSNGLSVILASNKEAPKIATMVAVKAGSKNDPSTNTGLAHYLEHMLFKGTDKYGTIDYEKEKVFLNQIDSLYEVYNTTKDNNLRKIIYRAIDSVSVIAAQYAVPNEYDKLMQIIGAEGTNAFTSFEQTVYLNTIPANEIHRWVTIEAERFRNPVLRLFHTELEAVYEEKNISMDNDFSKLYEELLATLFKKHNYGQQTTIGTVEHLKNPSLKAIKAYFETHYVPNNMAIVMVGDLDFDATIDMIASHFSYMQASKVPAYEFIPESPITSPIELEVTGPSSEMLFLGFRFPGNASKEADLLTMMNLVLSNSAAGLIDLNLNMTQKVLGAGCSPLSLNDYSVHYFYATAKEGQSFQEIRTLLLDQIEQVKKGNFDESLLKGILVNQTLDEITSFENNSNLASELMGAYVADIPWLNRLNQNYRLGQITKQEIMDFANTYYNNNYVVIYKKQGQAAKPEKIEKPEISQIPINREAMSDFLKEISEEEVDEIEPAFLDFSSAMLLDTVKNAPLFYIPNKRNTLFNLYYVIDLGTNHNKILSTALDYLSYVGTNRHSASEISSMFYALGSSFSVQSDGRYSYVSLSGLQEHFEASVKLFEHLLQDLKDDDEALNELKNRLIKSRENNLSNKNSIRNALGSYAYYGKKNPSNFVLSNKEIQKLKSKDLSDLIKNLLQYPHHIVYYGAMERGSLTQFLNDNHFQPSAFLKTPKLTEFKPVKHKKQTLYFAHYDMVQAEVTWHKPTIAFDLKQLPVITAYNEYFGGGMSSIVFQEIRESRALAYSTFARYSYPSRLDGVGKMTAYVGTQFDKFNDAYDAMTLLLNELPENERLMKQSVGSVLSSLRTSRTTKTSIYFTWRMLQNLELSRTIQEHNFSHISSVSMGDVVLFHKQVILPNPYILTVVADENQVSKSFLKPYGKYKKVKTSNLFGY